MLDNLTESPDAMGMSAPPVFSSYYDGTVNPKVKVDENSFLGETESEEYVPQTLYSAYGYIGLMNRNRPPFSYFMIKDMLCDPRILLGLWMLKGPLVASTEFEVKCSNAEVTDFVTDNLNRFYRNSVHRVLKALDWGFSASEVLYRYNTEDGLIHFDSVKDFDSLDCRPVVYRGKVVGFHYRRNSDPWSGSSYSPRKPDDTKGEANLEWGYLGAPRALWHTHWRDRNPYFGVSRLFGVHVPWWEKWAEDGYRNIRRLWFTKCAFDGGVMYHPAGTINTKDRGPMPARDYAREIIEKKRTGAVLTLPNTMAGTDGTTRAWEYQPPEGNPTPAGLLEYGESLDMEILEAFGIPPSVLQSSGSGGLQEGGGGGDLGEDAYHGNLPELNLTLTDDFNRQALRYLVQYQFGLTEYEVIVHPIGKATPATPLLGPDGLPIPPVGKDADPNADPADPSSSAPNIEKNPGS